MASTLNLITIRKRVSLQLFALFHINPQFEKGIAGPRANLNKRWVVVYSAAWECVMLMFAGLLGMLIVGSAVMMPLNDGEESEAQSNGNGSTDNAESGTEDDALQREQGDLLQSLGLEEGETLNEEPMIDVLIEAPSHSENWVVGTPGSDVLKGGENEDFLDGDAGDDWLVGAEGDDMLVGGAGDDMLEGGQDDDFLLGGDGADHLNGNAGRDVLEGNAGDDLLSGIEIHGPETDLGDDDILMGGRGDDVLILGAEDTGTGGAGSDSFVTGAWLGEGSAPTLTDFTSGEDTLVVFYPSSASAPEITIEPGPEGSGHTEIRAEGDVVALVASDTEIILDDIVTRPGSAFAATGLQSGAGWR